MYIYIVKINLRNLKNVMAQKVKLEREGMCKVRYLYFTSAVAWKMNFNFDSVRC